MTYREFKDDQDRLWEVWEVRPAVIERRQADDRRRHARDFGDRRAELHYKLLGGMRDGWLTFQCGEERRRLAPIPEGWTLLADETLIALAMKAATVSRSGLSSKVAGFGATPPPIDIIPESDPELF